MAPKKKAKLPAAPTYSLVAAKFGGEVAETCIPQIRPVIEALPPEDIYSFWCGLMSGFAGLANGTLPRGITVKVLESVLETAKRNVGPSPEKLN